MVEAPADGHLRLVTSTGKPYRMVLLGEAMPIAKLEGYFVHVEGQRLWRTVRVSDWEIVNGVHGMGTWVGRLEERGIQVGMHDRNSKAFYFLDDIAAKKLAPHVGEVVVVEGYVSGPHRVKVMFYRPLE